MIIKLSIPLIYARHKEAKIATPLSYQEKIKADRLVMAILLLLTIVGTILFA